MDPMLRDFLVFWLREKEFDQMEQIGRLLGVMFTAAEVRSWKEAGNEGSGPPENHEKIFIPLSFMLRPEAREGLRKSIGKDGLALPQGYRTKEGEVVVDLGKVTVEDFKAFVENNRVRSFGS